MNTLRISFMALMVSAALALFPSGSSAQQVSVSLSVFQNDLGRYGRWVQSPRYGQVWIYSEPGFRPYYSNGRWEYTDYGWAWVSDYDWGWGPFHYGRWEEDPYYGWIWIPGYEWAPAWVSWSEYGGNYGWAPLGFGLGINVSFGAIPFNRWTFVPRNQICSPQLSRYYIQPSRNRGFHNAVVINNIYVNNNTRFYAGPQRREVERYTRSRVTVRNIDYGRPDRVAANDRGRYDNTNRSGNIERPGRNEMPGRRPEYRSPDNRPDGNPGNDRGRDRNEGVQRPSTPGNFPDRGNIPNRSVERDQRQQRPSYERMERTSPERSQRPGAIQERPQGQGGFREANRPPEMNRQPSERPSRQQPGFGRAERGDNGNRGARRI